MNDITRVLNAIQQGEARAAEELLPLVYDELRKLAAARLAQEVPGQTLEATALVHDAYLRLIAGDDRLASHDKHWDGRGHFFAAAAEAMRRILIDNARRKRRPKHGGDRRRVELDEVVAVAQTHDDDLLALDEALTRLAAQEPAKAELVKLRYFTGMSLEECAGMLGISLATAKRHWAFARAWLFAAINDANKT
jgi:RNA polymerase sigma factor (TIGR02999 family)